MRIHLGKSPVGPWSREGIPSRLWQTIERLAAGVNPWPLFLFGDVGAGKTFAGRWLSEAVDWLPQDESGPKWTWHIGTSPGVYFTVEGLVDEIVRSKQLPWRLVECAELAVLDELGTRQTVSDLHYQAVLRFTSLRDERPGRAAVYISNAEPDAFGRLYDERIASRVLSGTVFKLAGNDRRFRR